MAIETRCTNCDAILSISDQHVGKRARCPHCQTEYTIPEASDLAALDAVCHYCNVILTVHERRRNHGEYKYKTCDECLESINNNTEAIADERHRVDLAKWLLWRFCWFALSATLLYIILSFIYERI
jgi:hypothetical protein